MKKNIQILAFIVVALLTTLSCSKDLESQDPISDDPTVPTQVTGLSVENQDGKATITYTVPNDPHLLYVKAVYTITNGTQVETIASYYSNSIVVEGFADTLEHEVKIYSVSRSEVNSAPISIKIKPLEAAIFKVARSIKLLNAFGGFYLTALNPSKANIAILVTKKNVFNEYEFDKDKSIYTNADTISATVRGLDTNEHRFGFLVRDRWGNKTDTIYNIIKPLYEVQFSPVNFTSFALPGDAPEWNNGETRAEYMWDGRYGWPWTHFTPQSWGSQPHMVTFNIGITAKISRVWIRPYPEGTRYYYLTTMKRFEIYGATNPSLSGALDNSWTLLGSYTVNKPSGLPYGNDDAVDQATAAAGLDWEVDINAPKVRYLRIRCLENWAGGTAQSINELRVYGDPR